MSTVVREYFMPSGRVHRLSQHLTKYVYSVIDECGIETFPNVRAVDDPRRVLREAVSQEINQT